MTEWLAILGVGAFLFFLIKGLAQLIVPALIIWPERRRASSPPPGTQREAS